MASARAPEQWSLTNTETSDSFERWRQNLMHHFSLDNNFSHMLKPGYKWERPTRSEAYRGFKDDGDNATTKKMSASHKSALLELMLSQIAKYCPVISRNTIVDESTSLDDIWHAIRVHFGFHKSGAHFLDYLDIKSEPDETSEDLFQRMTAFIKDNLLSKEHPITHHGVKPTKDEEFSPTIENLVVLRWLYLLHPDLPSLVKQRYATDLRSKSLASLKLEISTSLDSLLRELRSREEVRHENMVSQSCPPFENVVHAPKKKSCPICKQALRRKYDHFLLDCPYLPQEDRSFLTRTTVPSVKEFEHASKLEGNSTQSADTDKESSDSQRSDSAAEDLKEDEADDSKKEVTQLSESVFVYQNRKMSDHGNVFEGEIRSGVFGVRVCAIKIDRKSEQIVREARILNKINSHTHVISIIDSGIYKNMFEEHVVIALDKCHEHNLDQHITLQNESGVEFSSSEALEYSKQIIAGVTYLHENLIIHKDLKPSNILLSRCKSKIKLADFGLSQEIKSTSSKVYSKHQFGTNGFRPIESFGDSWVSLKSDTFSLGVVFYFVLSSGKSPFGSENSLWTYNIQNAVMDLSNLLVSKANMFEHLIKLMLSKERCRRPSIWQVTNHPCWTAKKHECRFDYGFTEEIDDSDAKIVAQDNRDSSDFESEMESRRQLLRALQKMGHDIYPVPPVRKSSIIIFDWNSDHLQRFNPRTKTVTQMHEFNDQMKRGKFTSVCIGDHVYVLMADRSMHRLTYFDVTATWQRMADLIGGHGERLPAIAASGSIILAGGSYRTFTKSVTKYDPSLNRWEKLKDKQLETTDSANVASRGSVYCIGGIIGGIVATDRVERLNEASLTWDQIASIRDARSHASAVECDGNLFVAGGFYRFKEILNSVETYDPNSNQWTIVRPTMKKRRYLFRCHLIDRNIYAIGRDGIEKYHVDNDEWEVFQIPGSENWDCSDSVLVKMKK